MVAALKHLQLERVALGYIPKGRSSEPVNSGSGQGAAAPEMNCSVHPLPRGPGVQQGPELPSAFFKCPSDQTLGFSVIVTSLPH